MTPPATHANSAAVSVPALAATSDGVRKMPAPTTVPTMSAMASPARSVGRGAACGAVAHARGGGAIGCPIGELTALHSPRDHRQPSASDVRPEVAAQVASEVTGDVAVGIEPGGVVPRVAVEVPRVGVRGF